MEFFDRQIIDRFDFPNLSILPQADAVHGHHFLRKSAQQKQTEDAELEEELDADAEEEVGQENVAPTHKAPNQKIHKKFF